jgi:hypothetical protein
VVQPVSVLLTCLRQHLFHPYFRIIISSAAVGLNFLLLQRIPARETRTISDYVLIKSISIKMDVCMSGHNSGTPGVISTKLGTHVAICMCKNLTMFYIHSAGRMVWEAGNLDDSYC